MSAFRWTVNGRDRIAHGSKDYYPYEDSGVVEADCLPEALLDLTANELFAGGLDSESEVRIVIAPVEARAGRCGHEVECETCGEHGCPVETCWNYDAHFRGQ